MTLKEMRMKVGYSQAELAKLSGINLRSLQDYEQGHKSIASAKGETLYRISLALGYSIEELLADSCYDINIWGNEEARMSERILAYEKALARKKDAVVHFPIIIHDNAIDMSRIYPTKQKMVKAVADELRGDSRIQSLRLFGSSITMRCNKDSDLDFAVGLVENTEINKNDISEKIQTSCDWGADILWLDRLNPDERVYKDIMNGLVIL